MIQDTSLWAHELAKQGLGAKQKQVLDALRFFPDATNAELAAHMQFAINRITPRIKELREQGLVLDAGRRRCKVTGGMAHCWRAKHPVLPAAFPEKAKVEEKQTLFN